MNSIKCGHCGLVEWVSVAQCRRCGNPLFYQPPAYENANYQYLNHEYLNVNDKKPSSHIKIGLLALVFVFVFAFALIGLRFYANSLYNKKSYSSAAKKESHASGVTVNKEPVQSPITPIDKQEWEKGSYRIKSLSCFEMEARVLGAKFYYDDSFAGVCPVDFALGWGKMSDQRILDKFSITQKDRKAYLETKDSPIPFEEATFHIANVHILPANDAINKKLKEVKEGDIVFFKGYLVQVVKNVSDTTVEIWKSSVSRTDTGDGACEIVWVESLEIKSAHESKSSEPTTAE
jgi:hypothetical protein